MNDATKNRPTRMTIVGGAWIVVGSLMAFSGAVASLQVLQVLSGGPPASGWRSPVLHSADQFFIRHYFCFSLAEFLIGMLSVMAGVQLLRLRAWARSALEAVSWFALSWIAVFGTAYVVDAVLSDYDRFWLALFEVVVLLITLACFAVPLGASLRSLRSGEVRDAITQSGGRPR